MSSWNGTKVVDDKGRSGEVVDDLNGYMRILTIQFEDGEKYDLRLNSIDKDPEDKLGIKWEYSPGQWAYLSDSRRFAIKEDKLLRSYGRTYHFWMSEKDEKVKAELEIELEKDKKAIIERMQGDMNMAICLSCESATQSCESDCEKQNKIRNSLLGEK